MSMKHDPDVFPAAVSKSLDPPTTTSIFASGEMVVAFGRSDHECLLSFYLFLDAMRRFCHLRLDLFNFKVQNIVCYMGMPHPLNLEKFEREHPKSSSWEPGIFAGMLWKLKPPDPNIVFILFEKKGEVVVAGLKNMEMIAFAEQKLEEIAEYMILPGTEAQHAAENEWHREQDLLRSAAALSNSVVIKVEQQPESTNVTFGPIALTDAQKRLTALKRQTKPNSSSSSSTVRQPRAKKTKLQTVRLLL